ncbi:CD2 antigen cytoplasmic tail-binding protein 2 [Intoshia linei]|uniref:CD2 antigen cytoplasmic tail-binding protein 2 n=1 Tax=Intoshia linei TaxID=1819745 RepID=A0A177BDJ8_9BILA|nr:CD2 antigen cytoplasmic tail-binding protein 2 [Intoshia linei]
MSKRTLQERENEQDENSNIDDNTFTQLPTTQQMDNFMKKKKNLNDLDFCVDNDINDKKHTIDSDEEESEKLKQDEKIGRYDLDADLGQEETGVRQYDDIKITPFNLKDECDDGYFDANGTFIFVKKDEIEDNWMDNIDWNKVETNQNRLQKVIDANKDNEKEYIVDRVSFYEQLMKYVMPKECVSSAIRRYGKLSKQEKLELKKSGQKTKEKTESTKILETITGIVSDLLLDGVNNIYEMTYEALENSYMRKIDSTKCNTEDIEDVLWEYQKDKNDKSISGPVSTLEMKEIAKKLNKKSAQVRKVGSSFYSVDRIDFDLYL